jgi:hypothetical protein
MINNKARQYELHMYQTRNRFREAPSPPPSPKKLTLMETITWVIATLTILLLLLHMWTWGTSALFGALDGSTLIAERTDLESVTAVVGDSQVYLTVTPLTRDIEPYRLPAPYIFSENTPSISIEIEEGELLLIVGDKAVRYIRGEDNRFYLQSE